jgi:hypothetical protein
MLTYPTIFLGKKEELEIIKQIVYNTKYDITTLNNEIRIQTNKHAKRKQINTQLKWTKFTYVGKQTKYITKPFKNSNLKIAYKTENAIERVLNVRHGNNTDKFNMRHLSVNLR